MIHLRYSNRTEELLRALAGDLAAARAAGRGLFEAVPLVVPNPQVETYVKLGVARENGVAAHLETKYLRGHLAAIVAASARDVALVDRATLEGELLALFHDDRRLAPDDLTPVRSYLAAGGDARDATDLRRAQLAAELATLFDEYAFARPELLRAWRAGRTIEGAGAPDDDKRPTERWERAVWLALHGRGGAFEARGRAEGRRYLDLPTFFAGEDARALVVPPATYIFGLSYVARLYRGILAALGHAGDVFIYALNPCREFWEDLDDGRARRARAADRERFPRRRGGTQLSLLPESERSPALLGGASGDRGSASGSQPDPREVHETPALALWGRPGRESIKLLNELVECDFSPRFSEPPADGGAPTLLAQLQHDILDQMDFAPIVRAPQLMDARIFRDEPMGLREDILRLPFEARFQYDHGQNMLFLNFEKLEVKSIALVNAIRDKVRALCEPLGHKVYAIVNYEGFVLDRDVEDAYAEMVRDVVERFYLGVTRFTTSAFMRAKLGEALAKRAVAPHIFESEAEAKAKAGLPHDLRPQ